MSFHHSALIGVEVPFIYFSVRVRYYLLRLYKQNLIKLYLLRKFIQISDVNYF